MKRLKRKLARDGQRIRKVRGGTRAVLIDQGGVRTIGGPCFELVNQSGDAIRVLDLAEVIDIVRSMGALAAYESVEGAP
jgi:hypothetical protein